MRMVDSTSGPFPTATQMENDEQETPLSAAAVGTRTFDHFDPRRRVTRAPCGPEPTATHELAVVHETAFRRSDWGIRASIDQRCPFHV